MTALFNWRGHQWAGMIARIYLGSVFILASLHKIAHPADFALDVATYQILPLFLVNLFAITLPWLELASGLLIVLGYKSRVAAWLMGGMMTMFLVALVIALANGLDMSCGCFASSAMAESDAISKMTVLRDLVWLFLSVYILIFDRRPLGLEMFIQTRRN